jgi:hypothetical protein
MGHPRQPDNRPPGDPLTPDERRRRYAELRRTLREWANDPSDFDDRVYPLIEEALRETAPRHFPDE